MELVPHRSNDSADYVAERYCAWFNGWNMNSANFTFRWNASFKWSSSILNKPQTVQLGLYVLQHCSFEICSQPVLLHASRWWHRVVIVCGDCSSPEACDSQSRTVHTVDSQSVACTLNQEISVFFRFHRSEVMWTASFPKHSSGRPCHGTGYPRSSLGPTHASDAASKAFRAASVFLICWDSCVRS
jgi:hypothetical protein